MSKHWERCPRCDSARVTTIGRIAMFFGLFGTGGCLIWVGLLFPPIWIFAGILILASPFSFLFPTMNQCRDCKNTWVVGKAREWKEALDDVAEAKKAERKAKKEEKKNIKN